MADITGTSAGETLTGGIESDNIFGLDGGDSLIGGEGSDLLDGGAGNDTMVGGIGDDTYIVDSISDVVIELAGEGTDTIQSSVSYTLSDNVEDLTLIGTDNINGTGNALNNNIVGNAGNNIINGGTGADTMRGEAGDDTYYVEDAGDSVAEDVGEGIDTVVSDRASYTLGANVENLVINLTTGASGTGNGLDNVLTGNIGNDTLTGFGGNDSIDGGAGIDSMIGGDGDDTFVVDNILDSVTESSGTLSGTDLVRSSVSYTLGFYVENLELTGTDNINATGNAGNNVITGNSGNNLINGGIGADTMTGGAGDDSYVVENIGDVIVEVADGGTDTVTSSVDYTLSAELENLTLAGFGPLNGTGNANNNVITGNASANVIDGGAGADTMIGGGGNDVYHVDNAGDVIVEDVAGGTDTVITSLNSYSLVGTELEKLVFTSSNGVTGIGNDYSNALTGGAGNDSLDGGLGNDTMTGGGGNDTYVVNNGTAFGDSVVELADEGIDVVQSSATYTLGANVEILTLTGTADINGTGNALDNVITGNDGKNKLTGMGGADTLAGGLGDDTYVVDADDVLDNAGETGGTDTVEVTDLSYSLAGLTNFENLTLKGTLDVNASGNAGANILTGNAGANIIDGGLGADSMFGGDGNDTYIVDDLGDTANEAFSTNGGTDLVRSSVNFTLGNYVEQLELVAGAGAINGTGNGLANSITGNESANLIDGLFGVDSMIGGKGDDTYVVDNVADVVTEIAGEGTDLVRSSVSYTLGDEVEDLELTGSAGLSATGNGAANTITGNAGGNLIDGGAGNDTMKGEAGNDTYVLDSASDVVIEDLNEGTADRVRIGVSYTLGDNVEELELTGSGNASGTGNALNNKMYGNTGNNLLDGGVGNDTMEGGIGNDTYVVDSAYDVVVELAPGGTDTVRASRTYVLGEFIENLELTGSSNLNGTGNALANSLTGNSGNNVLDGGAGIDTMIGGAGDDTYVVDVAGETMTEDVGGGIDTVRSAISFDLSTVSNIENVVLSGSANTTATGDTGANRLTGNTGNNILDGGAGADTMAGGNGNDTYYVDDAGDMVIEASGPSTGTDVVRSSVNYTLGANVENLVLLDGAINGTGNAIANKIYGNAAGNRLDGGALADTMNGGDGNDTYVVNVATDTVVELSGASSGVDLVESTSITYTLGLNVENLTLLGTANLQGYGNGLDNVLTGNSGANVLGGGAGNDTMIGNAGNDTYVVDSLGDVVTEADAQGIDTVQLHLSRTAALYDFVENITMMGTSAMDATGNDLANTIKGNAGANLIDGGIGADTMIGNAGDDTYIVDNAGDVINELSIAGSGIDEVRASVSYSINLQYTENLVLTGTDNIYGIGNARANVLTGNDGNNRLNGAGGIDTMSGGLGDDTFVVDNAGDVVSEAAGEGDDLVESSVSYTIADVDVERLTLTGTASINATGNASNNTLTGNAGANTLDGGAGADAMYGGAGDDIYIVDNVGDTVTEGVGGGTDTVQASVSYTLTDVDVENLTLLTGATNGTGNASANVMTGNAANNTLSGLGGADILNGGLGNDTLLGGAGSDIFVFNTALNASTNVDRLSDFVVADDTIQLENAIFTALGTTGTLDAAAFVIGTAATTADHRIIINGTDVLYDADGNGAGAAVKFATIGSATVAATMTNADFVVI